MAESDWRPTSALTRAVVVGAVGLVSALVAGNPIVVALAAPFAAHAVVALVRRPSRRRPQPITSRVGSTTADGQLVEGQGVEVGLDLGEAIGVEQVTRVAAPVPHVSRQPHAGAVSGLASSDSVPTVQVSPRRWGRHRLGYEAVAVHSPWAGFVSGPVRLPGQDVLVLARADDFGARGEPGARHGLVGIHNSRRAGEGSEFDGIRGFATGDRMRTVNWRVSARRGDLHVTTTRAEHDAAVLIVCDATGDHGVSEGVDGVASSLDLTVRAASALAGHFIGAGDRVGLRVIGANAEQVGFGVGLRHLRRIRRTVSAIQHHDTYGHADRLRLRVSEGTVVLVVTPMLSDGIVAAAAGTARRGLATVVLDTLPADAAPSAVADADPRLVELAWRMRKIERTAVRRRLEEVGCPVVAWQGPGTLDEVLTRLRRSALRPVRGARR